jgi:hypothetical protein
VGNEGCCHCAEVVPSASMLRKGAVRQEESTKSLLKATQTLGGIIIRNKSSEKSLEPMFKT